MATSFITLPLEVVVEILRYLPWRALIDITRVCRHVQHVIQNSASLQYAIELGAEGLEEGYLGNAPASQRLKLLLERRKAWRTLSWRTQTTIPISGDCQAYELIGGLFAKSMGTEGALGGSRHLVLTRLPSATDSGNVITREDVGVDLRDFSMDPSQDVIVYVEHLGFQLPNQPPELRIHLRTLSSNKPHPQARIPVLSCPHKGPFDGMIVQLCGDVVATFCWSPDYRLLIWQWTNGELLVDMPNADSFVGVDDFTLLSPRAFMLTKHHEVNASLDLYTFDERAVVPAAPSDALRDVSWYCKLQLPTLRAPVHYHDIMTHTGPFNAKADPGSRFRSLEDVRVHILDLTLGPFAVWGEQELPEQHPHFFTLVIAHKGLLRYVQKLAKSKENKSEASVHLIVPWEEWGPQNTRWLNSRHSSGWLRYVHGSRFIRALPSAPESMTRKMCLLDFNVHPLRPGDADVPESEDREHRYYSKPTTIDEPIVFEAPVRSCLPYREVTVTKELDYTGFLIDEERIVGMTRFAFSSNMLHEIGVFTF